MAAGPRRIAAVGALLVVAVATVVVLPTFGVRRSGEIVSADAHGPPYALPDGFLWGSASAAAQVEGVTGNGDWDALVDRFAADVPEDVRRQRTQYDTRFPEDLRWAAAMHQNAYRFSIAWERLFPTDQPEPDPAGVAYYRAILDACDENHLTPVVTLWHFALPTWLASEKDGKRGWERDDALAAWDRYVRAVDDAYGDRVHLWVTLNEPMVFAYEGFLDGKWPPFEHRGDNADVAPILTQLLKAHVSAYRTLHDHDPRAQVGIAEHVRNFEPYRNLDPLDRVTAGFVGQAFVWDFLDAIDTGRLRMTSTSVDVPIDGLAGTMDYVGLNVYGRHYVKTDVVHPTKFAILEHDDGDVVNDLGWASYPKGTRDALDDAWKRYHLPIYVLENGTADAEDKLRSAFLVDNVREIALAVRDGADVRGYFHWSLTDNFEWAEGFRPRFGLVAVDYEHGFARTPRKSADVYARIIDHHGVDAALWHERQGWSEDGGTDDAVKGR